MTELFPYFSQRRQIDLLFYPYSPVHAATGGYRVRIAATEKQSETF
jgi:hypothetical protein